MDPLSSAPPRGRTSPARQFFQSKRVPAARSRLRERLLDALPGGLAWSAVAVSLVLSVWAPGAALVAAALLALYTALRFALAALAYLYGRWLVHQWETTDWFSLYRCRAETDSLWLAAIHHLVVIPSYREDLDLLRHTLDRLAIYQCARTPMSVVVALEASDPQAARTAQIIRQEFGAAFAHLIVTLHPAHLPGEVPCKGANLTWAVRQARRVLVDELGVERDHILVTVMDADTRWHPAHFEALTVLFALDPKRYSVYWQAPIRYTGNVWTASPLLRALHAQSSAWELAYLAAPWWVNLPMSSYAVSLRLLDTCGLWSPTAIADEWHIAITSYFAQHGQQAVRPIFLPFQAHAVSGDTVWHTLLARYRQTLRHAWGAKEIGYTLDRMQQTPHTPRRGALRLLERVAHDNLMAGAGWIALLLLSQLPLLLHPAWARAQWTSAPFWIIQAAVAALAGIAVLFWIGDLHSRPPRAGRWTLREAAGELLGVALLGVLTALSMGLPVLHAQTRLLLGKPLAFRVTEKH